MPSKDSDAVDGVPGHALSIVPKILDREIGQDGAVRRSPKGLDDIQLGRIGREPFDPEPEATGLRGLLPEAAVTGGPTIPQ